MSALSIIDFPYLQNAAPLFNAVRDLSAPIWLDSGKPRLLRGRFDIISASPIITLETRGRTTTISDQHSAARPVQHSTENPFAVTERVLKEMGKIVNEPDLPFCGGLAGYFGYDLGQNASAASEALIDLAQLPDLRLGYYTWALIINHQTSKAWTVFHPACADTLKKDVLARLRAVDRTESESGDLANTNSKASNSEGVFSAGKKHNGNTNFELTAGFKASTSREVYAAHIASIKDYIAAGDCYQVNFAQHFSAEYKGDPWFAYQQLRTALPSPFSAFMAWDAKAILSLSPERFIKLSGHQVETRPIKGTAPRGLTIDNDREQAIALMNSAKNRAENLMIVDLLRNDLGKSCQPGSIRVPKLFDLESLANVHHLVSTVTGTLMASKTALDLLAGCFPGGSITGAPKKRAMEIIQETEQIKRSVYCGSIGYISACGRMDTNIAIRTLAANNGKLHCWGGGGIVADSTAEDEYQESITKIALLMETLSKKPPHQI